MVLIAKTYGDFVNAYRSCAFIARLLRVEYEFCRLLLKRLSDEGKVRCVETRFCLYDLLHHLYTGSDPPIRETIQDGVLMSNEVHQIVASRFPSIHLKTIQRKIRSGEIPSYKIETIYRVPIYQLQQILEASTLSYQERKK